MPSRQSNLKSSRFKFLAQSALLSPGDREKAASATAARLSQSLLSGAVTTHRPLEMHTREGEQIKLKLYRLQAYQISALYPHDGVLLSNKKEPSSDTRYHADENMMQSETSRSQKTTYRRIPFL